jgi:hypothetical protein
VTIDSVRVLKSRDSGLVLTVKGPYYFAAKYKSDPRADPSMAMAEKCATGYYWCGGRARARTRMCAAADLRRRALAPRAAAISDFPPPCAPLILCRAVGPDAA